MCEWRFWGVCGGGELALFGEGFGAVVGGAGDLLFECVVFGEELFVVVAEAFVLACCLFCFGDCLVGGALVVGVFGGEESCDCVDELVGCLFDGGEVLVGGFAGCEGECVEFHVVSSVCRCGACSDTRMHL